MQETRIKKKMKEGEPAKRMGEPRGPEKRRIKAAREYGNWLFGGEKVGKREGKKKCATKRTAKTSVFFTEKQPQNAIACHLLRASVEGGKRSAG